MSKDCFYFSHDSNAKDDPKCVLLIEQQGMEGYGIYWMLVETLRDQPDYTYPVANLPALGRRYNTSSEKVKTVVYNYELFAIKEDKIFFSESLMRRMLPLEERRQKLSEAGRRGNATRWNIATRSPGDGDAIATQSQVKESKVKKNREHIGEKRAAFSPPSLLDLETVITENGYTIDPQQFIDFYESKGWLIGKNKMKDWQAAVRGWARRSDAVLNPQPHEAAKRYFDE